MNRSLDAIQASATQVRLEPDSEAAKRNAVFYQQRPGVTRKDFIPRQVKHLKTTTVVLWLLLNIYCHASSPLSYTLPTLTPSYLAVSSPSLSFPIHLSSQDVMPVIERQELEYSFVHMIDEVSGHLIELMDAEERGATDEDEGTDEILVRWPIA